MILWEPKVEQIQFSCPKGSSLVAMMKTWPKNSIMPQFKITLKRTTAKGEKSWLYWQSLLNVVKIKFKNYSGRSHALSATIRQKLLNQGSGMLKDRGTRFHRHGILKLECPFVGPSDPGCWGSGVGSKASRVSHPQMSDI